MQLAEMSSRQQFVKYLEGDQHFLKRKVTVSPMKCYITVIDWL